MGTKDENKIRRFSNNENSAINMAKNEIKNKIEKDFPEMYEAVRLEASWKKIPKQSRKDCYHSEEETFKLILNRKILDFLITDLKHVKQMEGLELSTYTIDEVKQLLITLFYFRMKNKEPLYRDQENVDSSIKSINSNLKKGKLLYRYDEVYKSLIETANSCRREEGIFISEREEEEEAVIEYHKVILPQYTHMLLKILENDLISRDEQVRVFEIWYQVVYAGISVMRTLEKENRNLLYAYKYFTVILERMRTVAWYIFRYIVNGEETKQLQKFFEKVEKDIKQYKRCYHYDIIQNYGLCMELYGARHERNVWIKTLKHLADLDSDNVIKYQAYDKRYSVAGLMPETVSCDEIREKFCENNKIRSDRFERRMGECKKIYQWFSEHALRKFSGNQLIDLKAIYRECYIYNKGMPLGFGKIKALLNMIESGKLNDVYHMSEQEFFFTEKINRGIYRELDQMELYIRKNEFMIAFYEGEIELMNNMSGFYLSNWAYVLLNNIKELLEVGV